MPSAVLSVVDDPNEAYAFFPDVSWEGWWRVTKNGESFRLCPTRESAERYATDPAYRAELAAKETPLHLRNR